MSRSQGVDPASAASVYGRLQHLARQEGRSTDEMLTLYALERVLDRLTRTKHRDDLVLKGGVLLAAYRLRRPTRDIDVQLVDAALDRQHLTTVVTAIAGVPAEDGLVLDASSAWIESIRDEDEYSGLRVHLPGTLHTHRLDVRLDVSTGDPIWPEPVQVVLPGLLGQPVALLGTRSSPSWRRRPSPCCSAGASTPAGATSSTSAPWHGSTPSSPATCGVPRAPWLGTGRWLSAP